MSKERDEREEGFGFTEHEKLWDRMSDKHFQSMIRDEATAIHEIGVNTNSYGEFLFVSVSRPVEASRTHVTFFGLGYHEGRDRWIKDEWFWYENHVRAGELEQKQYTLEEADAILQERREVVQQAAERHTQSSRGEFFDMIADLTDDDGAMTDMEDHPDWFDDLDND